MKLSRGPDFRRPATYCTFYNEIDLKHYYMLNCFKIDESVIISRKFPQLINIQPVRIEDLNLRKKTSLKYSRRLKYSKEIFKKYL